MPQGTIAELVAAAQAGHLIGFPTDTVPAIASVPEAAAAIYGAKGRSSDKPLILMAASVEALWPYVEGDAAAQAVWKGVIAQHWPGALTLVLPKSHRVPLAINPDNPTHIGIRVPNWPIALEILSQTGPLATTSLNRSGQPPLVNLTDIEQHFPQVWIPTASLWQLPHGQLLPSTVAQWQPQGWHILRQGAVVL